VGKKLIQSANPTNTLNSVQRLRQFIDLDAERSLAYPDIEIDFDDDGQPDDSGLGVAGDFVDEIRTELNRQIGGNPDQPDPQDIEDPEELLATISVLLEVDQMATVLIPEEDPSQLAGIGAFAEKYRRLVRKEFEQTPPEDYATRYRLALDMLTADEMAMVLSTEDDASELDEILPMVEGAVTMAMQEANREPGGFERLEKEVDEYRRAREKRIHAKIRRRLPPDDQPDFERFVDSEPGFYFQLSEFIRVLGMQLGPEVE
jgi:hypothetical protein